MVEWRGAGAAEQLANPEMDGIDETLPAWPTDETPSEGVGVGRSQQYHQEPEDRCSNRYRNLRLRTQFAKCRVEPESESGDEGKHEPAGETIENNAGERRRWLARVARQPSDAHNVASNRGRKGVREKLAGKEV